MGKLLQDDEQLVGSRTVAGNTVRWVICDTESGAGAAKPKWRQLNRNLPIVRFSQLLSVFGSSYISFILDI